MRVWIDTDVGGNPDDEVALVLAGAHPDVDVIGVSTVSGDVDERADLARSLVAQAVPVVAGDRDLAREFTAAAPDALLAIGPLTNVARLLDRGVGLPERLVLMGGALTPVVHRGAPLDVETNFGADPAATRLVLDWTTALVVPLDVTVGMEMSARQIQTLQRTDRRLADALSRWRHSVVLHDPLALLVAAGDADATVEPRPIGVDGEGRVVERRGARTHEVVTGADTDAAKERIFEVLGVRNTGP